MAPLSSASETESLRALINAIPDMLIRCGGKEDFVLPLLATLAAGVAWAVNHLFLKA